MSRAPPQVALVNNIAPAHMERMGSLLGIAETKAAIYEALPDDGIAVVNADDAFAPLWRTMCHAGRIVTFGLAAEADFRATAGEKIMDWNIREMAGRAIDPREVATTLAFLGSPAASYVNGVELAIDGGFFAAIAQWESDGKMSSVGDASLGEIGIYQITESSARNLAGNAEVRRSAEGNIAIAGVEYNVEAQRAGEKRAERRERARRAAARAKRLAAALTA